MGLTRQDIGFICSGSSSFLAGQAFSIVMAIDDTGPISQSHVEMDSAQALYEAWVKLQVGDIDTAFVYSHDRSSSGSLGDVLDAQMDPYFAASLWPVAFAIEAPRARLLLEPGKVDERHLVDLASLIRRRVSPGEKATGQWLTRRLGRVRNRTSCAFWRATGSWAGNVLPSSESARQTTHAPGG